MTRILFIAPYPKNEAPSQRFRFEQYIDRFEEEGFRVDVEPFLDTRGWKTLYQKGHVPAKAMAMLRSFWRRFKLLLRLKKYDLLFIHREASMIGPPFFEWFIAKVLRRKYLFDFDDAIWLPNYSRENASFHRIKMYKKVEKIIRWADHVIAGNDFLAAYARRFNPNVTVIPTTIDTEKLKGISGNQQTSGLPVIGWTGSHTTAQYLKDIIPALDIVHREHPFVFRVISNQDPGLNRPYVEFVKWSRDTEIEDLQKINVGIMPLSDSEWAQGKCGFKALQYLSLEIPALVSPVGVNTSIIIHGENGYLCTDERDWVQYLNRLLTSDEERKQLGAAGRRTIEEHFSKNAQLATYLNVFKR